MHPLSTQKYTAKILLLVSIITSTLVFVYIEPISQDIHYHEFANEITLFKIHHFWNVMSNSGILFAGLYGLRFIFTQKTKDPIIITLVTGMVLTGIGSAYYHYNPNHNTLIWDRLPMTIVFTAFFGKLCTWYLPSKTAYKIWLFSVMLGIISVFYWQFTESIGHGDLRLYALVQFLPMLLIPIIVVNHHSENKYLWKPLSLTFAWYIIAKMLEYYDHNIYSVTNCISGHPIKHICAAIACYYIIEMVKKQTQLPNNSPINSIHY